MSKYIKLEDAIDALYSGFVTKTYIEDKLKELPTNEVSEDAISREGVLLAVEEEIKEWEGTFSAEGMERIKTIIETIPSVIPQAKEGEWIKSDIPCEEWVCSECGGACWYYDVGKTVSRSRYCPNCGSRMKGADDE